MKAFLKVSARVLSDPDRPESYVPTAMRLEEIALFAPIIEVDKVTERTLVVFSGADVSNHVANVSFDEFVALVEQLEDAKAKAIVSKERRLDLTL